MTVQNMQAQTPEQKLQKDITSYFSLTREVVYLQLNKSTLLQGEQLGFSAYVVNKKNLEPSIYTTNLYVQIKNVGEEVVKEEVLLVENGVASSVIDIDSTFKSGEYVITAFTNWMKNFKESNDFSEKIQVLEFNTSNPGTGEAKNQIDVQLLGESGHLLHNITNNVGVVVKDDLGYGLSNAKVLVKNSSKETVGEISLNQFGIGKFSFQPVVNETYTALVSQEGKKYEVPVDLPVEQEGIILTANQMESQLNLELKTNTESLAGLMIKPFILTVKGRSKVDTFPFKFLERESVNFTLNMQDLEPGINILTLFDEQKRPVAERLVFNYYGLPIEEKPKTTVNKAADSLEIRYSFNGLTNRNFSVSILPQNTLSYNRDRNILSHNFLRAFVRGFIEKGNWYFEGDIENKKDDMDNLLLTQGWSSYSWETIFEKKRPFEFNFEKHFEIKGNIVNRNKSGQRYMVHASRRNPLQVLEIPAENEYFVFEQYLPLIGETLNISRLKQNDQLEKANLTIDITPNKVPDFYPQYKDAFPNAGLPAQIRTKIIAAYEDEFTQGAEGLGEVLISAVVDREKERERKLNQHGYGSISVVKEQDINLFGTLGNYLKTKNLLVTEDKGTFSVTSSFAEFSNHSSQADPENPQPEFDDPVGGMAIYLDDSIISDNSMFYRYPLQYVDYVEINKTGMGSGFLGSNGSIKIYSKATKFLNTNDRSRITQFDFPLAYSSKKIFYTPKYENTFDEFFEQYGVIDWIPNLESIDGSDIAFYIKRPQVDFQMILEGITTDGKLIHEIQTFSADD